VSKTEGSDDKIRLAKLQYFVDFLHYAFHDTSVSGKSTYYTRRQFGPLSSSFNEDLFSMSKSGYLLQKGEYSFIIGKIIPSGTLSPEEQKTIDYVVAKYGKNSWRELVEISHNQSPYLSTKEDGVIPFFTAYDLVDEYLDYVK
jgi:hypothetical protein